VKVAVLAFAVVVAVSVPKPSGACPSVLALRLNDCDPSLSPANSCNVGLLRFDPWVAKFLVQKGYMASDAPLIARVALSTADQKAAEAVAAFMLAQDRSAKATEALKSTTWLESYDAAVPLTRASPFQVQAVPNLQRAAVIERDCNSFSVASLNNGTETSEHYALIEFQCQVEGVKTVMLAGVALKNSVPLRVYNGSVAPVCLPEPHGSAAAVNKPERGR
jgi:hypothetical protein